MNARINSDVFLTKTLTLGTDIYFTNLNYTLQDDGVNATTAPRYLALIKAPFLVGYSYTDDGTQLTNTLNDVDELGYPIRWLCWRTRRIPISNIGSE